MLTHWLLNPSRDNWNRKFGAHTHTVSGWLEHDVRMSEPRHLNSQNNALKLLERYDRAARTGNRITQKSNKVTETIQQWVFWKRATDGKATIKKLRREYKASCNECGFKAKRFRPSYFRSKLGLWSNPKKQITAQRCYFFFGFVICMRLCFMCMSRKKVWVGIW